MPSIYGKSIGGSGVVAMENAEFTVMLQIWSTRFPEQAKQPVPNFQEVLLITPMNRTDYGIYFVGLAVSSLHFCLVQGQAHTFSKFFTTLLISLWTLGTHWTLFLTVLHIDKWIGSFVIGQIWRVKVDLQYIYSCKQAFNFSVTNLYLLFQPIGSACCTTYSLTTAALRLYLWGWSLVTHLAGEQQIL